MKTLYNVIVIYLLLSIPILSQTITSTSTGGWWTEATTWIGGVVPGINNDAVINGPVVVNSNLYVRNLTVNSGASLENYSGYPDLYVEGNLVNNGTIKDGSTGYLDLYVKGNLTNNGSMSQKYLTFNAGTGNQILSGSAGFSVAEIGVSPNSTINAGSNLYFDESVYLNFGSDTLEMGTYAFSSFAPENGFSWGFIRTDGNVDVQGRFRGHCIGNVTFSGTEPMQTDGNLRVEGNLTVAQTKILENWGGYPDFYVQGNLTNYGTIRNNPNGGYLDLYCTGDVTNYGTLATAYLTFNGETNEQKIGGSSIYSVSEIGVSPNGVLWASSNLSIDENVYFNLGSDTLNMGSYNLTAVSTDKGLAWGYIYSDGELDVSGLFKANLMGNYKLIGNEPMKIGANVYLKGEVEVSSNKIIENYGGYPDVYVQGNLVNYGTIRNSPDMGGYIDLYINGNLFNHNTMEQSFLTFNGEPRTQTISGTSPFSVNEIIISSSGYINAGSDLEFDENVYLNFGSDTLDMGEYKLTNYATDRGFAWGYIKSEGELDISGYFRGNLLGNITMVGDSALRIGANVYFNADVTIAEGKKIENLSGYPDIYCYGDLINYGTIQNSPKNGGYLDVYCYGSIFNYNEFTATYLSQKVAGESIQCMGEFDTEFSFTYEGEEPYAQIEISDYFRNTGLTRTNDKAQIHIPQGAEFSLIGTHSGPSTGSFINDGSLYNWYNTPYNTTLTIESELFVDVRLVSKGSLQKLHITANNNQPYPNLTSSVKRWWRLDGENAEVESYILTFHYEDDLLNGQNEDELKVFVTTNGGEDWDIVSTPANTVLDKENNTITVGTTEMPAEAGLGDFIISANEIVELPSISMSISGRREIRVGPPNRYTITYWNNKDFITDYAFIELTTTMGVHIMAIETTDILTGDKVEVPIDSLTYDGVNDEVFLLLQPMQPNEVRTFDVILGAVPGLAKTNGVVTFGAVVAWTTLATAEEYVSNTVVEGCYEMWRPVKNDESLMDAGGKVLGNSLRKAVTVENGMKGIAKKGAESLLKKFGRIVAWPAFLAKDVFDCMGNTVRGMKDYLNGNFDKANKGLEKVTSWDPNAKEGPEGYGENGYMATSAPMSYTIFFENKKEATAPAWKIVILDTLDEDVFDINSVTVGDMSHDMGEFTQEGNVLKWEFVEIELPPNADPPEGEGWVKFTIHLKEDLPTGTVIENHAVITFDLNEPISTNNFINILDYEPPVTTPISLSQAGDKLELVWAASDGTGSGIKKSMVFVSSEEGPYSLAGVCDSSRLYIDILPEKQYNVYVLSEDNVGNSEAEPADVLGIITNLDEEEFMPQDYKLFQNYPNPFNPETTIRYWLPSDGLVELKIYNILGQEVITLVNEYQKAGSYQKVLNLDRFSSGVYISSFRVNSFRSIKKMMLLK